MTELILATILIIALVRWIVTASRMKALEEQLMELTRRVYTLEQRKPVETPPTVRREPVTSPSPHVAGSPEPPSQTAARPEPSPVPKSTPITEPLLPKPLPIPRPESEGAPRASTDWEALVGGNWLNKLGVLVLIIGISLLVAYQVTRVGPAGRVAIGLAVSLAILATGVLVEARKPEYRMFARGLVGGGWAGLYFTTYAMHALDAARIVDNVWFASILLASVAVGMILHSLKYKSQTVTGLAYFVAFATLSLTPATKFSVLALLPLAASLLYLANRFQWYAMALFGVLATYATCASRGDQGASVVAAQSLFFAYWLLFEVFCLMRARSPEPYREAERWIWLFNTFGFVTLSFAKWRDRPDLWILFGGLAILYLAGALVRARIRAAQADEDWTDRLLANGYEGSITAAATFWAVATCLKLEGAWITFGLAVEFEILFATGVLLGEVFLEYLAAAGFLFFLAKLLVIDMELPVREWTPVAAFTAVIFAVNRLVRPAAVYFSYASTFVVMLILARNLDMLWIGVAWLTLAVGLLEFGLRSELREFRIQAYILAALSWLYLLGVNVFDGWDTLSEKWTLAIGGLLSYGIAARVYRLPDDRFASAFRNIASVMGTLLFGKLTLLTLESPEITIAWAIGGLLMYLLGHRFSIPDLRRQSYIVAATVFFRCWIVNFNHPPRLAAGIVCIACLYAAQFAAPREGPGANTITTPIFSWVDRYARPYFSLLGTALLSVLLYYEVDGGMRTVAWGVQAVALLVSGFILRDRALRLPGLALFLACILKLFLYDLRNLDTVNRIISFVVLGAVMVGASWAYTRFRDRVQKFL